MPVDAGVVSVGAEVTLSTGPGLTIMRNSRNPDKAVDFWFSGDEGVRELARIIEALTALKTDLRAKVDA